ncbi:MAG: hypothetical protein ACM3PC_02035 [Deltaproteobacteria bacterium]
MLRSCLAALLISAAASAGESTTTTVRAPDASLKDVSSPAAGMTAPGPAGPARGATAFDGRKDDSSRLFHVGVMVGLVSLPRPLDAELYVRASDYFFVGFSYSDFPAFVADPLLSAAGAKSGSTSASLDQFNAFDADVRVFPFAGAFFLGSSFGRQSFKAGVTESTALGPQTATIDLATIYATPRLGYLWTFGPGIVLGLDAGVQLKLSKDQNVNMPAGSTQSMRDNAQSLVDFAGSIPLPSFHFRLGWQY